MSFPINVPYKKHGEPEHKPLSRVSHGNYGPQSADLHRSNTASPIDPSDFSLSNTSGTFPHFSESNKPHRTLFSFTPEPMAPREMGSNLSLLGPETHNPVFNVHSVVKNRSGSVLGRKTILKSEHVDSKIRPLVDFYLQGAPNFRSVDTNIYGVAQPTTSGLSTILTLLKCQSSYKSQKSCVWFSAREEPMLYINSRPFVLRDEDTPFQNIRRYQGINSMRIEQMEERLKKDVLDEANKGDGLLLVHDEIGIYSKFFYLLIFKRKWSTDSDLDCS